MLEQLLDRGSSGGSSARTSSIELASHREPDTPVHDRALRRGPGRGGGRRRAVGADPGAPQRTLCCARGDVRGGALRRAGGGQAGPSEPATLPCSPRRSRTRGWRRPTGPRARPALLERGVEIERRLGLELDVLRQPRAIALGRRLVRLGRDGPRPRGPRGARGGGGRHGETRSPARMVLWWLSLLEWLGRSLAAGARACHRRLRARRADAVRARSTLGWAGQGAHRGGSRPRRGRACLGRGGPRVLAGETSSELFSIVGARRAGPPRARARPSRGRRATTSANFPDGSLRGGVHDPTLPVWADAIETLARASARSSGPVPTSSRTRPMPSVSGARTPEPGPRAAAGFSWPPRATLSGAH